MPSCVKRFFAELLALSAAADKPQVSNYDSVMAKEGDAYYLYSTGPGITF